MANAITVTWVASTDNVAVAGYRIRRNGTVIIDVGPSTFSYVDTPLNDSTLYSYTVQAFDAARNFSAESAAASATTGTSGGVTPPPSSPSAFYKWDATTAVERADQSMAAYIASNLWNPGTPQAAFGAEGSVVYVTMAQAMVNVTWAPGWHAPVVVPIPIPPGTRPGGADDRHTTIVREDGKVWSMEWYQPSTQTALGIGIIEPGKANEGSYNATGLGEIGPYDGTNLYGGSNAANLDMSQVISANDVLTHNYKTLQFGMHDDAVSSQNTSVFPAPPHIYNDPRIPYGLWARLNPSGVVPSYGGNAILEYIDTSLRLHGMVMRDQATALTIYGFDHVNQGGNVATWLAAGVNLNLSPGWAGYPVGCYLPGIPWSQLQVLEPPPL